MRGVVFQGTANRKQLCMTKMYLGLSSLMLKVRDAFGAMPVLTTAVLGTAQVTSELRVQVTRQEKELEEACKASDAVTQGLVHRMLMELETGGNIRSVGVTGGSPRGL